MGKGRGEEEVEGEERVRVMEEVVGLRSGIVDGKERMRRTADSAK